MGVDYNIVIAEGLVLYNPDSYLKYVSFEDVEGINDQEIQELYNKYEHPEYNVVQDCYKSNTPIFIYKKDSVVVKDKIWRAYGTSKAKQVCEGDFKDRPYIVGQDLAVYPINFYNDEEEQDKKIKIALNVLPIIYGEEGFYCLKIEKDKLDLNKMSYGKFVFIYYD